MPAEKNKHGQTTLAVWITESRRLEPLPAAGVTFDDPASLAVVRKAITGE